MKKIYEVTLDYGSGREYTAIVAAQDKNEAINLADEEARESSLNTRFRNLEQAYAVEVDVDKDPVLWISTF